MKKFLFALALLISSASAIGQVYSNEGTWFNRKGRNKFNNQVLFDADVNPTQITANQNNYKPTGLDTANVLKLYSDASRQITGIDSVNTKDGRTLYLFNVGSFDIVLKNQSTSSLAGNRFAFNADVTISSGMGFQLLYDSIARRWRGVGGTGLGGGGGGTPTIQQVLTAGYTSVDQILVMTTTSGGGNASSEIWSDGVRNTDIPAQRSIEFALGDLVFTNQATGNATQLSYITPSVAFRDIRLPDADGIVALTTDITSSNTVTFADGSGYTVLAGDKHIVCTENYNGTMTLPSAAANTGRRITITTNASGSFISPAYIYDAIASTSTIQTIYTTSDYVSNGTNWIRAAYNRGRTLGSSGTGVSLVHGGEQDDEEINMTTLLLKDIKAGAGITLTPTGNDVTIAATVSSTPGIDAVLAVAQVLTTNRSINAGGNNFSVTSANTISLSASSEIDLIGGSSGVQVTGNLGVVSGYFGTNNFIEQQAIATPTTPDPGAGRWYVKSTKKPYFLNSDGVEYDLTAGGGTGSNLSWDATNHEVDIDGGGTSAVIPFATGSVNGLMSTTTQTIAGAKTYSNDALFTGTNGGEGYAVKITNSNTPLQIQNQEVATTATMPVMALYRIPSSGNGVNGYDMRIDFGMKDASGSTFSTGSIVHTLVDATGGSTNSEYSFKGVDNSVTKVFMTMQTGGVVIVNNGADSLSTKDYARSLIGGAANLFNTDLTQAANRTHNQSTFTQTLNGSASGAQFKVSNSGAGNAFTGETIGGTPFVAISGNNSQLWDATTTQNNTTTTRDVAVWRIRTSGTAGVGFGQAHSYLLERSDGADVTAMKQTIRWTNATAGATVSEYAITLNNSGSVVERLALNGSGQFILPAYTTTTSFAGTPVGVLGFDASGNVLTMETPTGGGGVSDGDKGDITVSSGGTVWTFDYKRNMIYTTATGTNANITAVAGTAYNLPAATLSANRTIDVSGLTTNGDYVEFFNNEEGFLWSFTGATVYDSDGTTTVTDLLINANSVVRRVNGKLMISKL